MPAIVLHGVLQVELVVELHQLSICTYGRSLSEVYTTPTLKWLEDKCVCEMKVILWLSRFWFCGAFRWALSGVSWPRGDLGHPEGMPRPRLSHSGGCVAPETGVVLRTPGGTYFITLSFFHFRPGVSMAASKWWPELLHVDQLDRLSYFPSSGEF